MRPAGLSTRVGRRKIVEDGQILGVGGIAVVAKERFSPAASERAAVPQLRPEVVGRMTFPAILLEQSRAVRDGCPGSTRRRRLIPDEPCEYTGEQDETRAEQQRRTPHHHMSHPRYPTWNRSVSIDPLGTPRLTNIVSVASIMAGGPQTKQP